MKTYKRILKLNEAVKFVFEKLKRLLIVADIGTDHGYLAESLSKEEFVQKVIASDISDKSLSKIEQLIKLKSLKNIETLVGDGLCPIEKADVSVIAGIGGHEIIKILETQNTTPDGSRKCDYFVLQPAQNVNELRIWIFENKIKVIKDYIIYDSERFYPIIIIDVSKKERNRKSIYNVWLGRDNTFENEDFVMFLKDLKVSFEFLKDISKKRAKQDKMLYQKYKLNKIIEKLLKMWYIKLTWRILC